MSESKQPDVLNLSFDAAAMLKLAQSAEAQAFAEGPSAGGEAAFEKNAIAFVKKAKELGIASIYWGFKPGKNHYGGHRDWGNVLGAMAYFLPRKHCSKALAVLAKAGATPWMVSAVVPGLGSPSGYFGGGPGAPKAPGISQCKSSEDLARAVMGDDWSLTARKLALKSALSGVPSAEAPKLIEALAERYESATGRASKTSKGVLGASDKRAKDCATVIMNCHEELLRFGEQFEAMGVAGSQGAAKAARDLVGLARECLSVKADKQNAVVDPEKVRKAATSEERLRASALVTLSRDFAQDQALLKLAFESTEWLSKNPMLASVRLGRDGSIFQAALAGGSEAALTALEKAGANIWLAAAQAGESNACAWVCQLMSRHEEQDLSGVARLLMIGSWLDGAPDPKARCLELAVEATNSLENAYYKKPQEVSRRLSAEIERLTLNELVEGLNREGSEGESEEQRTPRRRSSAL